MLAQKLNTMGIPTLAYHSGNPMIHFIEFYFHKILRLC